MPTGNGITVRVKDANGDSLEEAGPSSEEPRQFRCRLIAATPGTRFEITVIVEKRFAWQGADTLFIAIAYDDGLEEHLGGTDFTMAWAIPNREDCLGEHTFTKATKHGSDSAALLKTTYSMPDAVAAGKFFVEDLKRNVDLTDGCSSEKYKSRPFSSPLERCPSFSSWLHFGVRASWPSIIESNEAAACRASRSVPVRICQ